MDWTYSPGVPDTRTNFCRKGIYVYFRGTQITLLLKGLLAVILSSVYVQSSK